jgi:magnesium transporter
MEEKTKESTQMEVEDSFHAVGNLIDSKTSHLDDLLVQKLEDALHTDTSEVCLNEIAKLAADCDPIDLAYAAYMLPASARFVLLDNLPTLDDKVKFLINADKNTRVAVFRFSTTKELCELIELMPSDEVVSLFDDMPRKYFKQVIEELDIHKAKQVFELRRHQVNTAGRMMANEYFAFNMNTIIGEAAAFIRKHPGIDLTRNVFVTNEKNELQGVVPVRNLVFNPQHLPLEKVMLEVPHQVTPDSSREEVIDLVERYKIPSLPVVNDEKQLVGIITYEDVVEAMEDLADDTIAHLAGTGEDLGNDESIFLKCIARAPWLLVTLFAGLLNALTFSYFQSTMGPVIIMFFVPFVALITGMSGNVGIQTSTVLVRSMATGMLTRKNKGRAIRKEVITGLFTGLAFGLICGFVVAFLNYMGIYSAENYPFTVGLMVGLGLMSACLVSTFLGVFSPLTFAKLGVDPAIASGPIITAFNDVSGTIIYFLVVHVLSRYFFT